MKLSEFIRDLQKAGEAIGGDPDVTIQMSDGLIPSRLRQAKITHAPAKSVRSIGGGEYDSPASPNYPADSRVIVIY